MTAMMKITTAATNRLGNRASNQDRVLLLETDHGCLLTVADGMGGHDRGELAAQTTIDTLRTRFLAQKTVINDPRAFLRQAIHAAHFAVIDAGNRQQPSVTPRTTCVSCLVQGNRAWWAHVGDSRLYLLRDSSVATRTRDHTPVEKMLQKGEIAEKDLRHHPLRNSVSRCLGGAHSAARISFDQASLQEGDMLVLCSDGLWSALPDDRLVAAASESDIDSEINRLADEAERASYPRCDNISVVALRWHGLDRKDTPTPASSRGKHGPQRPQPADPVQQAIEDIHRAMIEYASEMKK